MLLELDLTFHAVVINHKHLIHRLIYLNLDVSRYAITRLGHWVKQSSDSTSHLFVNSFSQLGRRSICRSGSIVFYSPWDQINPVVFLMS